MSARARSAPWTLALVLAASGAAAQSGPSADVAPSPAAPPVAADAGTSSVTEGGIADIVVTSQKRSENVQQVPISVSVLSGEQLQQDHIENFADLTRAVPNLSFSSQAGEGLSTLELRGISSQAGTATVALYLDDVSLTTRNLYTQGTAEPRFLDIDRVEVLRGPQSTLYGASALGGTLRYISNPPKLDVVEGSVFSELSGTSHGTVNWDEQAVLNVPLADNQMALRLSAETSGDGGYIANVNPADGSVIKSNINSDAYTVVRGTLLYKPTDWLTLEPSVYFQRAITRDVDAQYLELPSFQTPKVVAEPGRDTLIVPSLTITADLGFADLTAVSGNYERQFTRTLDSTIYDNLALYACDPLDTALTCTDNNGNPVFNSPPGLFQALNNLPSRTFYSNTVRQWSEEVRVASKPYDPDAGDLPFTWIAGLYYSDEHTTATDTEFVSGADAAFKRFGANPADPTVIYGAFPGGFPNDQVFQGLQAYDTAQYAVFGEATYYPWPNVRLTVGGRYEYARDGEKTDQNLFYAYGDTGPTSAVSRFFPFTPKFAGGWDITPDETVYFNVSKGFRLGSENRRIAFSPGAAGASGTPSYDLAQLGIFSAPTQFGPDKLWNYEIGDKAKLFGGRVVVSFDVFYIHWSAIQTEIPLVTSGLEFQTNAGSATSYGSEFEIHARVAQGLTVGFSGSGVNATLDNGVNVNGKLVTGTFKGENVPGVPDYNFALDARQDFSVTEETTGFVAINPTWVGESHGNVVPSNPDYKRPGYFTLEASAGLDWGAWQVSVFGRNLTNNNKIIQRPDIQGSASPLYEFSYLGQLVRNTQGFTLRPLTIGANLSYKF